MPDELPDLDGLAARDARGNIVHGYVGVAVDNGGLVLFVQRRSDDEFHPGRWEVPVARIAVDELPHARHRLCTHRRTGLEIDEITDFLRRPIRRRRHLQHGTDRLDTELVPVGINELDY